MIYKSGKIGCYDAYDYVKNNLSKIGNIKSFKAFYEDMDKYSENVNGRKEFYNFILFNENDEEFWIDSNCGYPGTGPSFTNKMLEILGVRKDYKIGSKKIINEYNIHLNHNLNILVKKFDYRNDDNNIFFMIECKFQNPNQRMNFISNIESLGYIQKSIKSINNKYSEYFSIDDTEEILGEYQINNILSIDNKIASLGKETIETIIKTMFKNTVQSNKANIEINYI